MNESILDKAKEFHGHLGPYAILGWKIGLRAVELLGGKRYFGIHTTVRCPDAPPPSCMVDGLQMSTGCTMGKRNIELIPSDEIVVTVRRSEPPAEVVFRPVGETIEQAEKILREQGDEAAARWLWEQPDENVFTYTLNETAPAARSGGD